MWAHSLFSTMANLTDFTSYDEIRAVLGVSDEELENATLALPMYYQLLSLSFGDMSATLESTVLTISQMTPGDRTSAQQKLLDVSQVYSAYATSYTLLTSLPLFAPKRITDGRAETDRVTDPFKEVREGVTSMLASLRNRLLAALEGIGQVVQVPVARVYFGTAPLGVDPVTNV